MYKILIRLDKDTWEFHNEEFVTLHEASDKVKELINDSIYLKCRLVIVQVYDYDICIDLKF